MNCPITVQFQGKKKKAHPRPPSEKEERKKEGNKERTRRRKENRGKNRKNGGENEQEVLMLVLWANVQTPSLNSCLCHWLEQSDTSSVLDFPYCNLCLLICQLVHLMFPGDEPPP